MSILTDLSGNGLHLTLNTAATHSRDGLAPVVDFAGNGSYHHPDAATFDIIGNETRIGAAVRGLTLGGWFRFDRLATDEALLGKWTAGDSTANSYLLQKTTANRARFLVGNSTTTTAVTSGVALDTAGWFFVAGRFTPSAELAVWTNNAKVVNTASVPATLNDSSTRFEIAARNTGATALLDGRVSLAFLCAAALPDIYINTFFQFTAPLFGVRPS